MKVRSVAFALTLIIALAAAESAARSQPAPVRPPPPDGPYQASCASYHVERRGGGRYLVAICHDADGRRVRSRLRLPCDGDIDTAGGRLVCRPADPA